MTSNAPPAASIVLVRAVLPGPPSSLFLLAGVFAGSAVWRFAVSGLAVLVGLRRAHLVVVDRVAGGLLVLAGGVGLISVL